MLQEKATFVVTHPLSAVCLAGDRCLTGITRIPAGESVELRGKASLTGMVEVFWLGKPYALFPQDLSARSIPSPRKVRFG